MRREAALSVAIFLVVGTAAIFLSLGRSAPRLTPANLRRSTGVVGLAGFVVAPPQETGPTLSFVLTDRSRKARVHVVYPGAAPVSLRVGRQVNVRGVYRDGLFVAEADTLIVSCGTHEHC
jgi:cytochrome c-type biogenesis protein CcmE